MEEAIDLKYIKDYSTSEIDSIIQTLVSDEIFRHRMNAMLENYFKRKYCKINIDFDEEEDLPMTTLKSRMITGGSKCFMIPPCAIQIDSKEEPLFG